MIAAAVIIASLLGGSLAISALTIGQIATLAGAGVTIAQVAGQLAKGIKLPAGTIRRHEAYKRVSISAEPPSGVCFTGAPSGRSAHFCP